MALDPDTVQKCPFSFGRRQCNGSILILLLRYSYLDNKTSTVRRLYNFSTPVLGVVGTSPRQGKLTLQVNLKSSLENVGYKCGFFSTEQSGFLYGADCIFQIQNRKSRHSQELLLSFRTLYFSYTTKLYHTNTIKIFFSAILCNTFNSSVRTAHCITLR